MSRGTVNKAIVLGRLGHDPEVRFSKDGKAIANLSVATDRSWKDKDGNWQDETTWHKIICFSFLADKASEKLKKGSRVYVEGRLQFSSWEDKDGVKRSKTEIVAASLEILDSDAEPGAGDSGNSSQPQTQTTGGDTGSEPDDVPF